MSQPDHQRRVRRTSIAARGEPMVWLTGGAVAVALLMIVGLLGLVAFFGAGTFWPKPIVQIDTPEGIVLGEVARTETVDGKHRTLYKTGNFDTTNNDFTWVDDADARDLAQPVWAMSIEREAWGNAYGTLESFQIDGKRIDGPSGAWTFFQIHWPKQRKLFEDAKTIQNGELSEIARKQNQLRLELRDVERKHGADSEQAKSTALQQAPQLESLQQHADAAQARVQKIYAEMENVSVTVRTPQNKVVPADHNVSDKPLRLWQITRMYPANQPGFLGKLKIYASRWREFLFADPREANTEGGVWPAIIGTVMLTMIMVIVVVPIGVIAAIYLREYARQGLLLSIIRISVNNLAGVPSIVYGVFGLGFFCYLMGGSIDAIFFESRLPDPTFGKSAMLWASLTLALLTLPVVIVATEEALAAVPRSMREGSYACGASKWQTIRRIVLPRALPGIMTGMILAIARGAGEVAPLMLVGAVKLAPELPISLWPSEQFGLNRSFMHLGFHIYDLAFQSRNSEAARGTVYTTTLLLISLVVTLNLAAIFIRSRLRRAYAGGAF